MERACLSTVDVLCGMLLDMLWWEVSSSLLLV